MGINIENFTPHIILAIFAFCLLEYALQAFWNPLYYRIGIPCFFFRFKLQNKPFDFPIEKLQSFFTGGFKFSFIPLFPPISFGKIKNNHCGFCEKYWIPSMYFPVMHGLMSFDSEKENITITARLNYVPVIILVFLIWIISPYFKENDLIHFAIIFFILSFSLQALRYLYISLYCVKFFKQEISVDAQQVAGDSTGKR